jgi:hypothetical protein
MTNQHSIDQLISALKGAIAQHGIAGGRFDAFDLQVFHGAPATEDQIKISSRDGAMQRVRLAIPEVDISTNRPSGSSSNMTWMIEPSQGAIPG